MGPDRAAEHPNGLAVRDLAEQWANRGVEPPFDLDINQDQIPDHHQALASHQGIEGVALLFSHEEHLLGILKVNFYRPAPGVVFQYPGRFQFGVREKQGLPLFAAIGDKQYPDLAGLFQGDIEAYAFNGAILDPDRVLLGELLPQLLEGIVFAPVAVFDAVAF